MPAKACTRANLEKGFRLASKSLENIREKVKKSGTQLLIYCCKISSAFNLVPNGFLRFGEKVEGWRKERKKGMTYNRAGNSSFFVGFLIFAKFLEKKPLQ